MNERRSPTERDDPQAIQARVGTPRPEYDHYEVNQPGSINKQAKDSGEKMAEQQQKAQQSGERQAAYGNSKDEEGRREQDMGTSNPQTGSERDKEGSGQNNDKTDATLDKAAIPGEVSQRPDQRLRADAQRPILDPDED